MIVRRVRLIERLRCIHTVCRRRIGLRLWRKGGKIGRMSAVGCVVIAGRVRRSVGVVDLVRLLQSVVVLRVAQCRWRRLHCSRFGFVTCRL